MSLKPNLAGSTLFCMFLDDDGRIWMLPGFSKYCVRRDALLARRSRATVWSLGSPWLPQASHGHGRTRPSIKRRRIGLTPRFRFSDRSRTTTLDIGLRVRPRSNRPNLPLSLRNSASTCALHLRPPLPYCSLRPLHHHHSPAQWLLQAPRRPLLRCRRYSSAIRIPRTPPRRLKRPLRRRRRRQRRRHRHHCHGGDRLPRICRGLLLRRARARAHRRPPVLRISLMTKMTRSVVRPRALRHRARTRPGLANGRPQLVGGTLSSSGAASAEALGWGAFEP